MLTLLQRDFFYVDPIIHIGTNRLKIITICIPLIPHLKNLYNLHNIQALNIIFLCQHYEDINHDHNLQMSHILCFTQTKIHHESLDMCTNLQIH